ncbi:putative transcription factor C2H2 family [Medicago truncatula]|uniref:RING-type E3 ubiquitin transferase n=1 Tax=Medicago truncatula TaxID=3880 RepID=A0A396GFZ5_MEDTR|nr:putative transcription factor C2H2 family [Medicago truncatula]
MKTTTILEFFTIIALMSNSFQENITKILHKLYKNHGSVKEIDQGESDCCSVCLNQMCKGEKVKVLPLCNHRYHADCIGVWLKNNTTCPLCRSKISNHNINQNQQKLVKPFQESLVDLIQSFSDVLVAILYMILPSSITETFPVVY